MIEAEVPAAQHSVPLRAPRADWLAGHRAWRRGDVRTAVVLGVGIAVLAVFFRTEIVPTDPWHYVQSALTFPSANWVPLGYTRYGMILPLVPLTQMLGSAQVVYYVAPVAGAALLAASLYLIGVRFWGRLGGVLAVVLAFSSTLVFVNMSRGYPDLQSTGLGAMAIVLALHARDRRSQSARAATVPLLAVGFLLGWAFEARETTVFLWPLVAIVLWSGRSRLRTLALVVAPMAAWALTDITIGLLAYSDALIRVHAFTRQDLAKATIPADVAVQAEYVGRSRWFYLTAVPRLLTGVRGGWWTLALGAVGLTGLLGRRGGTRFAALCLFVTFLGFVGVAGLFFPHHPSGRIDIQRYWVSFIPFAGLAAAGVLMELTDVLARRVRPLGLTRRAVALVVLVAAAVGPGLSLVREVASDSAYVVNGADQLPRLRSYLSAHQPSASRIFTDGYTARLLPIYRRSPWGGAPLWSAPISNIASPKAHPKKGDLIIINSRNDSSCLFCGRSINAWIAQGGQIKKSWKQVWATPSRNLVVYEASSAQP